MYSYQLKNCFMKTNSYLHRADIALYEGQVEELNAEFQEIQGQAVECQAAYEVHNAKDRQMDRSFKNHFADLSPIIVEQAYKFFK